LAASGTVCALVGVFGGTSKVVLMLSLVENRRKSSSLALVAEQGEGP